MNSIDVVTDVRVGVAEFAVEIDGFGFTVEVSVLSPEGTEVVLTRGLEGGEEPPVAPTEQPAQTQ